LASAKTGCHAVFAIRTDGKPVAPEFKNRVQFRNQLCGFDVPYLNFPFETRSGSSGAASRDRNCSDGRVEHFTDDNPSRGNVVAYRAVNSQQANLPMTALFRICTKI
jgi:hypothetical protein